VPLGDQPTDGAHITHTNASYLWSAVADSAYSIVLVVADGQSLTTDLTSVSLFFGGCKMDRTIQKNVYTMLKITFLL